MNTYYITGCLLGLLNVGFAQTTPQSEAFWSGTLPTTVMQQAAPTGGLLSSGASQVMLVQQGVNNQLRYVGAAGEASQVSLTQQGDGNRLSLATTGRGTYLLDQLGNGNTLQLTAMQGDGIRLQVRQQGNDNHLIGTGTSFGSPASPIRIEQSGGARAIISSTYQ